MNQGQGSGTFPPGGISSANVGSLKGFFERLLNVPDEKSVKEDRSRQYHELARTFLSVTVDRVNELEDDRKELTKRLDEALREQKSQERVCQQRFDEWKQIKAENAALTEKYNTLKRTNVKQVLEANNALLIEVEHLKKVIGGYKSHATKAKSKRRKR